MPPPEMPSTFYNEQQQILRDIRDELRADRTGGAPAAMGGGAGSSMSGRPSNNFVKSQMMADKLLDDKWGSLAWSNAYSPAMKSSITGDIMGAFGMSVAPNTMNQAEFQAYTRESLGLRVNTTLRSIIAPGSTGRINSAADELAQMSSRFMRAGDSGVGMFGVGMDRAAAREIQRGLETEAIGNLRLSYGDYNTIQTAGMQSGQFDFAEGANGFVNKMKELTTATADLTRVTRMSVEQITQSMGALRQFGVGDVAEQSRIIQQTSAAARVAGVTPGEMSQLVNASIQNGLGQGLTAGASADIASSNAVLARNLTRSGMISTQVAAAGGGTMGIANSITQMQQGFAGSQAGYLASLGGMGGGTDYFAALAQGVGTSGGTFQGMMGMQAGRLDYMSQMTGSEAAQAHRNMLQSQMRIMGVTDFTSTEARNMAFAMTKGQLGEAGALAYSRANFSDVGLYNQSIGEFNSFRDTASRQRGNEASRDFEMQGGLSTYRRAMISMRQGVSGIANEVGSWFGGDNPDVAGQMAMRGASGLNEATIAQLTRASFAPGPGAGLANRRIMSTGLGDAYSSAGAWGGGVALGVAGGWGGMKAGALLGSAIMPGIGTVIGAGLGIIGGSFLGSMFGEDEQVYTLNSESAKTYASMQQGIQGPQGENAKRVKALLKTGSQTKSGTGLMASSAFRNFVAKSGRDVSQSASGTASLVKEAERVAAQTGENVEVIMAAAKEMGMDVKMAGAYGVYDPDVGPSDALKSLTEGLGAGFDITNAKNAGAVASYAKALQSGNGEDMGQALQGLKKAGLTGGKIDTLRQNLEQGTSGSWYQFGMGGSGRLLGTGIIDELGSIEQFGSRQALGNILGDAVDFAGTRVRGNQAAQDELADIGTDKIRLLELLEGKSGGGALRDALGSEKVFADVIKMSSMTNLTSMGSRDLAQKFAGLSESAVNQAKEAAGGDEEKMRRALGLTMLQGQNIEQIGGFDAAAKTAGIQRTTADILVKLAARLDVNVEDLN